MRHEKCLGFNDKWLVLIGIPLLSFVMPFVFFGEPFDSGLERLTIQWGVSMLFTTIIWLGNRWIWSEIHTLHPENEQRRIMLTLPTMFSFTIVACVSLHYFMVQFHAPFCEKNTLQQGLFASVFSLIALVSIYEALHFFNRFKSAELENERLRRSTTQAQLDGLRQQVNPHFLFNSLNTLATLIPENQENAVHFVEKLSKVYRYLLDLGDRSLVSFEEEIHFTENYIFLLKERFGENIQVKMDLPDACRSMQLPPLTLQILVENAVKHNVISSARPLKIDVFPEKAGRIVVKNNLQPKNRLPDSPGHGLENVKARYAFFTQKRVDVLQTTDEFVVLFPLVEPIKINEESLAVA